MKKILFLCIMVYSFLCCKSEEEPVVENQFSAPNEEIFDPELYASLCKDPSFIELTRLVNKSLNEFTDDILEAEITIENIYMLGEYLFDNYPGYHSQYGMKYLGVESEENLIEPAYSSYNPYNNFPCTIILNDNRAIQTYTKALYELEKTWFAKVKDNHMYDIKFIFERSMRTADDFMWYLSSDACNYLYKSGTGTGYYTCEPVRDVFNDIYHRTTYLASHIAQIIYSNSLDAAFNPKAYFGQVFHTIYNMLPEYTEAGGGPIILGDDHMELRLLTPPLAYHVNGEEYNLGFSYKVFPKSVKDQTVDISVQIIKKENNTSTYLLIPFDKTKLSGSNRVTLNFPETHYKTEYEVRVELVHNDQSANRRYVKTLSFPATVCASASLLPTLHNTLYFYHDTRDMTAERYVYPGENFQYHTTLPYREYCGFTSTFQRKKPLNIRWRVNLWMYGEKVEDDLEIAYTINPDERFSYFILGSPPLEWEFLSCELEEDSKTDGRYQYTIVEIK